MYTFTRSESSEPPALFSTFQHRDWSLMKTATTTKASHQLRFAYNSNITNHLLFVLLLLLFYCIAKHNLRQRPEKSDINMAQVGLECIRLLSYNNVVQVSLNVSGNSQKHQYCCSVCILQLAVCQILFFEFVKHLQHHSAAEMINRCLN